VTYPVLWIRHGTSLDGALRPTAHARPDTPIAPHGVTQIAATARHLRDKGVQPAIVLTSPYPRAAGSAAILAELLGAPLAPPDPIYAEWRAPDCVLGITPDDYPPEYRRWRAARLYDPDSALPDGESLTAFHDRATHASSAHQRFAAAGVTLIVSHRVLIGAVAAISTGVHGPADVFRQACAFPLDPAQVWRPHGITQKSMPPHLKQ